MKRLFFSVALVCSALIVCNPMVAAGAETTIMLKVVCGVVEVQKHGTDTWDRVFDKALLVFDDSVRTRLGALARLLYYDSSMLKLKENTVVQIGSGELRVQVGEAWVRIIKKGTHFQVVTPTLIAGVKGTIFDVSVKEQGTSSVRTYNGLVAVNAGGEEVLISAGYATSSDGGVPSAPAHFNADEAAKSWRFSSVDKLREKVYPAPVGARMGRSLRVPGGSTASQTVTPEPVETIIEADSMISYQEAFLLYKEALSEYGKGSPEAEAARKIFQQALRRDRQ